MKRANSPRKKQVGHPATGINEQISLRWPAKDVKAIDEWRRKQADLPNRGEAIRQLVRLGLGRGRAT
jgi:hypothetical protein